jgi:hypothetical protein
MKRGVVEEEVEEGSRPGKRLNAGRATASAKRPFATKYKHILRLPHYLGADLPLNTEMRGAQAACNRELACGLKTPTCAMACSETLIPTIIDIIKAKLPGLPVTAPTRHWSLNPERYPGCQTFFQITSPNGAEIKMDFDPKHVIRVYVSGPQGNRKFEDIQLPTLKPEYVVVPLPSRAHRVQENVQEMRELGVDRDKDIYAVSSIMMDPRDTNLISRYRTYKLKWMQNEWFGMNEEFSPKKIFHVYYPVLKSTDLEDYHTLLVRLNACLPTRRFPEYGESPFNDQDDVKPFLKAYDRLPPTMNFRQTRPVNLFTAKCPVVKSLKNKKMTPLLLHFTALEFAFPDTVRLERVLAPLLELFLRVLFRRTAETRAGVFAKEFTVTLFSQDYTVADDGRLTSDGQTFAALGGTSAWIRSVKAVQARDGISYKEALTVASNERKGKY